MSLAFDAANLRAPSGFPASTYPGVLTAELSYHQHPAPSDIPVLIILDRNLTIDAQAAFFEYLDQNIPAGRNPSAAFSKAIDLSRDAELEPEGSEIFVNAFFSSVARKLIAQGAKDLDEALGIVREGPVGLRPQVCTPQLDESGDKPALMTKTDWGLAEVRPEPGRATSSMFKVYHLLELKRPALSNVDGELDSLMKSLAAGFSRPEDLKYEHQVLLIELFSAAINLSCFSISYFDGKSYMFGRIVPDERFPQRYNLLLSPKTPFTLSPDDSPFLSLILSTLYPVYSDQNTAYAQRIEKLVSSVDGLAEALAPDAPAPSRFFARKCTAGVGRSARWGNLEMAGAEEETGGIIEQIEELLLASTLTIRYPDYCQTPNFVRLNVPAAANPSFPSSPPALSSTLPSSPSESVTSFTPSPHTSSLASPSACPRPVLHLRGWAGSGITGDVYWAKLASGASVVAKLSREGHGEELAREFRLLDKVRRAGVGVDVYGVFGRGEGKDAEYAVVMEDGGAAVGCWTKLSVAERQRLILDLLRLHLIARIQHGDARPPNAVVEITRMPPTYDDSARRVRWMDIIGKTGEKVHSACRGLRCKEVENVICEMGLTSDEVEEVSLMAEREGLLDKVEV
ncbi:hypothetical protein JCM11251_007338 [Rhodosporidiobolus azoricus]